MNSSVLSIKAEADRLITRLKMLGVHLKRTQAHEAVAAVHNFSDWNRLKGHLDRAHQKTSDHKLIILGPGEAKTSLVTLYIADAIQENKGIPLLVDLMGASTLLKFPAFIKSHMALVNVKFDASGSIVQIDAPPVNAKAFLISMTTSDFSSLTSLEAKKALTKAFCRLPEFLASNWPKALVSKISKVFIDEIQILDEENKDVFDIAMPAFNFGGTEIIMGSQIFRASMSSKRFSFRIIGSSNAIKESQLDQKSAAVMFKAIPVVSKELKNLANFDSDETLIEDIISFVISSIVNKDLKINMTSSQRAWLFGSIHKELTRSPA